MTTPAEIEAALFALPAADRGELLDRARRRHEAERDLPENAPSLTDEQWDLVNERIARLDRGETELVSHEEVMANLTARVEAARRAQEGGGLADAA